ncbi:SDR family NAD(P)-dependent oxidoreductase [Streptomyces sp. NPDC057199]|uniref:SDR family NAD(P)-dependent oxidoreductase n=1 Tax=Streptomyces sp. NPDC057199 TaxID=3346047 RepID=UPI003635074E
MTESSSIARSTDFDGVTAVVTGGAGGIGSGIVAALRTQGAQVAALDLRSNPEATLSVECDLTDQAAVDAALAGVVDRLGTPGVLVCASGICSEYPYKSLKPAEWQRVVDASLTATYLVTHAVVPEMAQAGRGAVVTFSSGWATKGYPLGAHYAAAKAGIEALTKSLALEFAASGVRVNSVAPGPITTPMILDRPDFDFAGRAAAIPLGRIGEVSDVVDPVLFLAGDGARYITGQVLHVNGGLLMP